jgi:hypothetical protein
MEVTSRRELGGFDRIASRAAPIMGEISVAKIATEIAPIARRRSLNSRIAPNLGPKSEKTRTPAVQPLQWESSDRTLPI